MATDVNFQIFPGILQARRFLDQNNIQSSDLIAIFSSGSGVIVVYTSGTADTEPPFLSFADIPDGRPAGVDVQMYIGTVQQASLAPLTDDPSTSGLVIYYRKSGDQNWKTIIPVQLTPVVYRGVIPGPDVQAPEIEYYIVGRDTNGQVKNLGTASSPKTFTVV